MDGEGDFEGLAEGDGEAEALAVGLGLADGETDAEGDTDPEGDALVITPSSTKACSQLRESFLFRILALLENLNAPGIPLSS